MTALGVTAWLVACIADHRRRRALNRARTAADIAVYTALTAPVAPPGIPPGDRPVLRLGGGGDYAALCALSRTLGDGELALVVAPNAAAAPMGAARLNPLAWLEGRWGRHRPGLLSRRVLVRRDNGHDAPEVHFTLSELRNLVESAGFDVLSASGGLGPEHALVLRRARPPRAEPLQPWWVDHLGDGLPLDYMTTREDVAALVPQSAREILDVGCAAGALGARLRERGARVTGIEMDARLAALAEPRLDLVVRGDAAEVLSADAELLAERFDCIVFADCLEHMPDPGRVLGAAVARLAPGGTVVISLPNVRRWDTVWHLLGGNRPQRDSGVFDRTHLHFFTRDTAVAMVRYAGLVVREVRGVPRVIEAVETPLDAVAVHLPGIFGELTTFQWLLVAGA